MMKKRKRFDPRQYSWLSPHCLQTAQHWTADIKRWAKQHLINIQNAYFQLTPLFTSEICVHTEKVLHVGCSIVLHSQLSHSYPCRLYLIHLQQHQFLLSSITYQPCFIFFFFCNENGMKLYTFPIFGESKFTGFRRVYVVRIRITKWMSNIGNGY